jgi:hypothetical protein
MTAVGSIHSAHRVRLITFTTGAWPCMIVIAACGADQFQWQCMACSNSGSCPHWILPFSCCVTAVLFLFHFTLGLSFAVFFFVLSLL